MRTYMKPSRGLIEQLNLLYIYVILTLFPVLNKTVEELGAIKKRFCDNHHIAIIIIIILMPKTTAVWTGDGAEKS